MKSELYAVVCGLSAALAAVASAALAASSPTSQEWRVCTGEAPVASDLVIKSCTAVIQSNRETKAKLAIAHYHRATAYRIEGHTDRAIQDYDRAIELDSKFAGAYNQT